MLSILLSALALGAMPAAPTQTWRCRNQIEVWCAADGCAAAPPDEFTPLDITLSTPFGLSVCAYTGCWEGRIRPRRAAGRLLWIGDKLPFSTAEAGEMAADVTVLLFAGEGVGFVRAGGLATPLLCVRVAPGGTG